MINEVDTKQSAEALLQLIQKLSAELHRRQAPSAGVGLDSSLDRDLGLDSLARMELIARIERHFGIALSDRAFIEAETPRDLLQAILRAGSPRQRPALAEVSRLELAETEPAPLSAQTLLDVLLWHVSAHPDRPHIQLYNENEEGAVISYRQLLQGAEKVASGLQRLGLQHAEPVALMLQAGHDYFFSFFGVLLAGGIPVPIYPPARPSQIEDHMRRHRGILSNCQAVTLITEPEAKPVAQLLKAQVGSLRHIVTTKDLCAEPGTFEGPLIGPEDIAFLQYTSGSTGNPKGVVLSHRNLLANIRAMGTRVQASATDVFVSWLPLYHDMGLIGAWFGSLYYAALFVVLSPLDFITRPQRWLWAIHRYRGTLSAAPNFAYELCLRRVDEMDLEGLDLNSWRAAFNGAEAISPSTLRLFGERYGRYGLHPDALMPVYGLAESTVGLAFPPPRRGPIIDRIKREPFMREGRAIPAAETDTSALEFVACGQPLDGHQVRIVDRTHRELPDRQEGLLQFCGPSATGGYFRNPDETRRLFHGDWLNSGDLAYIAQGDVYLTGRIKDIIIRAGRNIYPHELEETIGLIEGIRAGRVAAFGSADSATGTERLIILAETHEQNPQVQEQLRSEVNAAVSDLVGAPPDEVVLAPPETILKTSSGKLRRTASRELFESGRIGKPQRAVWLQIVRLTLEGIAAKLRRARSVAGAFLYGLYARTIFWLLAPAVWLLVVALPRFSWRWALMRWGARTLARLTATPITVRGLENLLPPDAPCVYVSNHASYLDGPLLVGTLGREFSFVAKAELTKGLVPHLFLRRIGADFVERFEAQKGIEDFHRLARDARAGRTFFFFPEGTFTRSSGLLPFHMGAFIAAAEAGVPVIPVTIRGTRSILRGDDWLPNRGAITVSVGKPIRPDAIIAGAEKDPWTLAVALRDAAREEILRNSGEPDLARGKPFP